MNQYSIPVQIRWADIDQNRHLRHSAYYDYAAMARLMFLEKHGLTTQRLEELRVGPVLFREEAIFKREIRLEDKITIDIQLLAAKADFSRWSIRHSIVKDDGTVAALIQVDGAWLDLVKRKLVVPNELVQEVFRAIPAPDLQLLPDKHAPASQ